MSVPSRPGLPADLLLGPYEERLASGCSQVQLGFRYESRDQRFTVYVMQLSNCSALCLPADHKMYVPYSDVDVYLVQREEKNRQAEG